MRDDETPVRVGGDRLAARLDGPLGRVEACDVLDPFEESLGLASPTGEDLPPEQIIAMLRDYWTSLPPALFPHTLALVDELFSGSPDERFEFGIDVIVRGLAAQASS